MRPLFIYDGQCSFCSFWAKRWQLIAADQVDLEPHQTAAPRFPQIADSEFSRAAKLIEPNGQIYSGAAAVLKLWAYTSRPGRLWWWNYRNTPLFAPLSEYIYRFVARHRSFLWTMTKTLFRVR
jgi:predicted DCC family thiol-disulfide oxidoreductase YuxK